MSSLIFCTRGSRSLQRPSYELYNLRFEIQAHHCPTWKVRIAILALQSVQGRKVRLWPRVWPSIATWQPYWSVCQQLKRVIPSSYRSYWECRHVMEVVLRIFEYGIYSTTASNLMEFFKCRSPTRFGNHKAACRSPGCPDRLARTAMISRREEG